MYKNITKEKYIKLSEDFYKYTTVLSHQYDDVSYMAIAPLATEINDQSLAWAKFDFNREVEQINAHKQWIAERGEDDYDVESMKKMIANARSRKSRAKAKIQKLNKEFEKALAWAKVFDSIDAEVKGIF